MHPCTYRQQLEQAKKEAEQKARKVAAEKEELQALLKEKEEEKEAELAARNEAVSVAVHETAVARCNKLLNEK